MGYQSSKNKLQEILQKRGEAPPTYTAVASNREFRATVTLPDGRSTGPRVLVKNTLPTVQIRELIKQGSIGGICQAKL